MGKELLSHIGKCQKLVETPTAAWWGLHISSFGSRLSQNARGAMAASWIRQRPAQVREQDKVTAFVSVLKACTKSKDLCRGSQVHDDILRKGYLEKCSDALVTMYAKCGDLENAQQLFEIYKSRNVCTWTALMAGYAQMGQGQYALDYFEQMQRDAVTPNAATFNCILKTCGSLDALDKGVKIHEEIAKQGLLESDIALGNALMDMYVKCGALSKARQVLEGLSIRDTISWTAMISGYAEHGKGAEAMNCFKQMKAEGLFPNAVTFICILKACGGIKAYKEGRKIHSEIAKQGLVENDIKLGTALVDMYAKCNDLAKAQEVLEDLPLRTVVSWNALISGYADQGEGEKAWNCYEEMRHEGLFPNAVTFICILKACGSARALAKGEKIHDEMNKQVLLQKSVVLANAVVDMYIKCNVLAKARQVVEELQTRNAVSWNTLITGYCQQGECDQALDCFERMQHEGFSPDAVTFVCILKACSSIGVVDKGDKVHQEIAKQGLLGNNIVLGTALTNMYAKCGAPEKARRLLEELPARNAISWSAVISGYGEQGKSEEALDCFDVMQREGLSPDAVTFICVLKACGNLGAADKGENIHNEISKQGLLTHDVLLGTALVDMYAKCGVLVKARQMLEEIPSRDVVTWNALVSGCVQQCEIAKALECLEQMHSEGLSPNAATFSSVLSACSRVSLVKDAQMFCVIMVNDYGMTADIEHYTCMVDLFGRAGHLDKAIGVIERTPSLISAIWSALLSACRKWGDVNVGRWAFDHGVRVDSINSSFYALMASIYSAAGMQEDARSIKAMRAENKTSMKSL